MSLDAANQMAKLVDYHWRETTLETDEFSDAFSARCMKLPKKSVNVLKEKWPVRTFYNESESGASFDGGDLATGGNSTFQNLYVPYRTVSHTANFTQEAIDNNDSKSHYNPVVDELNQLKLNSFKQLNRHLLMGDGTGAIAVLSANYSGGATTTATAAPNTTFGNKGVQFVKPGKLVQIYDATGATLRNGTIGSTAKVTVSTSTLPVLSTGVVVFTSAGPSDAVSTDIIVPEGMGGRGINGLPYWNANSGSIFELSRSTYPGLSSTMIDGASGSILVLVEAMFAKMLFRMKESAIVGNAQNGKHELFWSPTQRQKYRTECLGLGITQLGSDSIDAGYGHREKINGHDCTVINDHDNQKISFLRMSDWYLVGNDAANPFELYNEPGSGSPIYNVRSTTTGGITTSLAATTRAYVNLACKTPRDQGAIYGLPTTGQQTGNA